MTKRILLALLLLLAPLSGAGAQPGAEQRIRATMRQAEAAGIPVALLEAKVAEGRAKGVPLERIAAGLERRLALLQGARQAMGAGRNVSDQDLSVGADALGEGVEPAALGALAAQAPPAQRAQAIVVLTQLVQQGVASEQALRRVQAALARGPEELRQLPGEGAGAARGSPPAHSRAGGGQPGARGQGQGRGRGQGGPPASVPGPRKPRGRPDDPGNRP